MGTHVDILGDQSGLHIVLHVHNGMNERELIQTAAEKSKGLSRFYIRFSK